MKNYRGRSGSSWLAARTSRRTVLRGAGVLGAGAIGAALVGCGDEDEAPATGGSNGGSGGSGEVTGGGAQSTPSGSQNASDIKRGGTLKLATRTPPSAGGAMDPHLGRGGGDHTYFWRMTESLVTVDPEFRPQTQLAESYEQVDDLTLRFNLKENITFHDGSPLTAEVVKLNLERVIDPEGGSSAYGQMRDIAEIETPDERTVVIKTAVPNAAILPNMADRGGQVVSGEQLARGDANEIARGPIGTGPFKMHEWVDGSHVEMRAWENYWDMGADGEPLPYLEAMRHTFVEDAPVRATVVQTGDADIASSIQGNEYLQLEADPDVTTHLFIGTGTQHLRINLHQFPDMRVRQAMTWALDRQAIHDGAFGGVSEPAVTPITPAHAWAWHKDFQDEIHEDLEKAAQLLSAAGHEGGLELPTLAFSSATRLQVQIMQAQWERIGIRTTWEEATAGNYTGGSHPAYNTTQYSIRPDPSGTLMEIWHSQGSSNAARQEVGPEWVGDAELDAYLEKAQQVFDLEERAENYHRAEEIMALDAHGIFMGFQASAHAHRSNVNGFTLGAEGKGRFNSIWLS